MNSSILLFKIFKIFTNRLFQTIVIGFILIFVIGFLKDYNSTGATNSYNEYKEGIPRLDLFTIKAYTFKHRFDIVIIGDSRTVHGISPDDMEEVMKGLRVGNAGYDSLGLNKLTCTVAKSYLNPSSSKKVIIFLITPISLTPLNVKNESYLQELKRSKAQVYTTLYLNSVKRFFTPIPLSNIYHKMYFYFYQDSMTMDDQSDPRYPTWHWVPCNPNIVHRNGWHEVQFPKRRYLEEQYGYYQKVFLKNKVSEIITAEFLENVYLLTSSGIKVYGLRMKPNKTILEFENQMSGFNEKDFLKRFQKMGGHWLDFNFDNYTLADGSHLDPMSARHFSKILASAVNDNL